jgi:hypothetical protein
LDEQVEISRDDVAQTSIHALHDDAPKDVIFEIIGGKKLIGEA